MVIWSLAARATAGENPFWVWIARYEGLFPRFFAEWIDDCRVMIVDF
jgi:hypothetical protein